MKKFLSVLMISLLSLVLFSCTNEPTEEVLTEYTLTFSDNSKIDLTTGVYSVNPDYCSTGKIKAIFNSVIPNEVQFHYLHLWSTNGYYLGYYIGLGNDDTSTKYLGTYTSGSIVSPDTPFYFALSINKSGVNSLSPIGSNTYDDLFGSPTFLSYTDSVIGGSSPTGTLADLGSYTTLYYDDVLTGSLQDAFNNPSYTDFITEYSGMTLEDIFYRSGTPSSEQLLTNSDFTDNINGYNEENTAEISYDTGKLLMVKNAGTTGYSFNFQTDFIEDHIYFIDVRAQRLDTVTFAMTIEDVGGDIYTSIVSSGTLTDLFMNEYYANYQAISDDVVLKGVGYTFMGGSNNNTTGLYFDYIRAYDLTYIFGSGNEVSAEVFKQFLAGDSYTTLRTIQNIGYSGDDLDDSQTTFTARSIPVLTLTNSIQNGQFTTDSNNDGVADGWAYINGTPSINSGRQYITSNGNIDSVYLTTSMITINGNYYYNFNFSSATSYFVFGVITSPNNFILYDGQTNGNFSGITTLSDTQTALQFALYGGEYNVPSGEWLSLDNVSIFLSSTYTKTQIDTALINFGYLPYNTTYYLPDMGTSGTGERGFGTCGDGDTCYAVDGSGIGTDLEIYDYYTMYLNGYFTTLSNTGSAIDQWQEWRASYGDRATSYPDTVIGINPYLLPLSVQADFTIDHTARDYYIQLYKDAVNEVDRWEWYSAYGVTAENYSYYAQLFADANDPITRWEWWKDDGITASNYDYYINPLLMDTLYLDGYNEVDRWEWYKDNGITSSNYAENKAVYDLLLTLTPIDFTAFQSTSIYFLNTVPLDATIIDGETYDLTTFKGKTNYWLDITLGLSSLIINLIALAIMFICLIPLFIFKAQWPFYLIVEVPLFSFFVIMEWFAVWVVLIVVALAVLLMYLVMNKQNG